MAYDEHLAERLRELVAAEEGVSEQRMFGGLAFLVHGNMAVAASGQGGLLLRVDPADTERHLGPSVERMVMRGRAMDGWLAVADDALRTKRQLERWVRVGVGYARSLPPKGSAPPTRRPARRASPVATAAAAGLRFSP